MRARNQIRGLTAGCTHCVRPPDHVGDRSLHFGGVQCTMSTCPRSTSRVVASSVAATEASEPMSTILAAGLSVRFFTDVLLPCIQECGLDLMT